MSHQKSAHLKSAQNVDNNQPVESVRLEVVENLQKDRAIEDRLKLLRVFPEELWVLVLDKLKGHQDVATTANSTPYFWNILNPRRTLFLFSQVWSVLGKKFESSEDPVYDEVKETLGNQNLPNEGFGLNIRWFSGILKLRRICKTWCNAIDNFYQTMDEHYRMKNDATKPIVSCKEGDCCHNIHQLGCWTRVQIPDPTGFVNNFRDTHADKKSPFLSNAVKLLMLEEEERFAALNNFILVFGKYIWHCVFILTQSQESLLSTYAALKNSLIRMPNLRSLRIMYMGASYNGSNPQGFHRLSNDISQDPMPFLEHLKFLETYGIPKAIFNELLQKCSRLTSIEVRRRSDQIFYNIFSASNLPISQLSLEIYSQAEYDQLKTANWKLTKVYLDFSNCCYIPWSQIFRFVEEKWGDTAKEVMLHLPSSITQSEILTHIQEHGSLSLYLPRVYRLRLALGNISSIDFVLPMKNQLKQLDIFEVYKYMKDKQRQMWENGEFHRIFKNKAIKFGGLQCCNQNNIWEVLPELQYFEYYDSKYYNFMATRVYTRYKRE